MAAKRQREDELRGMSAQELHLRLVEDLQITRDFEARVIYARLAEAQTQEVMNELILEAGGAVVYFESDVTRKGMLLRVTAGRGFEDQPVVRNPKFAVTRVGQEVAVKAEEKASEPLAQAEAEAQAEVEVDAAGSVVSQIIPTKAYPKKKTRRISPEEVDLRRESKKGGLQGDVTTC